jgi:integrase
MPKFSSVPNASHHKASGQAVVRLSGKDHYLGAWHSAAARGNYERLVSEWLARGRLPLEPTEGLTVNELILAYDDHCLEYYRKDGRPTTELDSTRSAMRPLTELYGRTPSSEFGPLALKGVRDRMVKNGWCRNVVNKQVGRVKRLFRWAVENELVPPGTYHALQAIGGLRRGRSNARETVPVRPVPVTTLVATTPFLPPPVHAMVELQLLTGMRPGEACAMRACDLDISGRVWIYRPATHKTEHHGTHREIYVGPKAQEVIKPYLKLDTQAYLFSPAQAEEARNAERRRNRQSPVTPCQARRKRKPRRKRPWGDHYNVDAYRRAIQRACQKAFPLPAHFGRRLLPNGKVESYRAWRDRLTPEEQMGIRAWRRQHTWHPHQLRHNAATNLRREHGVELARIILGHATAFTTEIYAEVDRREAIEIIARIG